VGWPSDVASITKAQADEYYSLYYAPQNLTAILVGDFDPKAALALAEKYLGSIPRGTRPAPEMITTETRQIAEKRFHGEAETNPAVDVRWHTPAYVHKDVPALELLDELLSGPAGRLNRSLVLQQGIATSATSQHDPRKYEGLFELHAECKEGHTPEELEKALYAEVEKLQKEPVSADELQSARNRYLANTYRQLTSSQIVMFRYAVADGRGTWSDQERIEKATQAVTAGDLQRVANQYFTKENRAVAIWTRKGGTAPADAALAALPPESRQMVEQLLPRIAAAKDPAQLEQMLARMDQMAAQAPPEAKGAMDYVRTKIQARIEELKSASATPPAGKN
jgi:predicted Zn-dependent peptidase